MRSWNGDTCYINFAYLLEAAQAGLYYHYGIKKHILNKKISGVYEHHPLHNKLPIIRGFDDKFYVPHSRNTGVDGEAIRKNKELTIVAESDETGPYIILNSTGSQVFVTGHPEYDVMSLHYEYVRDVKRGLNPDIPKNYYKDDDPTKKPVKSWRCHANAMYYNWLNYYVYQVTPYDLEKDSKKQGCYSLPKYGSLFEIMIQHVDGEKKGKQMIKLIATDIDGTLVADGTLDLNPEYYDVIKELKRRGTIVLAASGRQRASIEKVFTPVLDDISFISENGLVFIPKIINM